MTLLDKLDIATPARLRSASTATMKRETSEMCRERAAADLLASVAMLNANQRTRLETSAAAWTARAHILQRVEDGTAGRSPEAVAGDEAGSALTRL